MVTHDESRGREEAPEEASSKNGKRKVPKELRDLEDYNKGPESTSNSPAASTDSTKENGAGDGSRRTRRRSSASQHPPAPSKRSKTNSSSNNNNYKKSRKAQEQLDMAWICVACREAECAMDSDADLLVCEGPCRRLFHTPCAGLAKLPPEEVTWQCHDCLHQKHLCGFCQEYGKDQEEVFKCQKSDCGHFFHEACLEMQNILIELNTAITSTTSEELTTGTTAMEEKKVIKFTCPAHHCWTCTQEDLRQAAAAAEERKGRGKKGSKKGTLFAAKRETRLFPCLECPISYHLTCIPPNAKFHELALLCHEHADKAELPALDVETSIQGSVEARVEKKLQKMQNRDNLLAKRAKFRHHSGRPSKNPFFPRGVVADKRSTREQFVLGKLSTHHAKAAASTPVDLNDANAVHKFATDEMLSKTSPNDPVLFCLPADVQEEVHSKPPLYKHIHALKYYPENKPKKIPLSRDICNCTDTCDDHCLNRLLYVECFGTDKGTGTTTSSTFSGSKTGTNCRLGPNCGNRQLGLRQHVKKCQPRREQGKGWGLVTLEPVQKGALVQEYLGDVIDETEKERRLQQWNVEHPNDPNYYIMCLSQGWYVDARETANLARFINHSCDPNCILLRFNVGGYMRDGIFAKRDLKPGEFLSYDYHFDTKQGDKFVCRCGSANCRGTMKEKMLEKDTTKKTSSQLWKEAKQQLEKDKEFLAEMDARDKLNATIGPVLPGTGRAEAKEGPNVKDEWVSNGVPDKDRIKVIRNRIFLWRNAVAGSDFEARFGRYLFPELATEGATVSNGSSTERQPIRRKTKAFRPNEKTTTNNPKGTVDVIAMLVSNNKE